MQRISRVILYDEPSVPQIQIGRLARLARDAAGVGSVEVRGPVWENGAAAGTAASGAPARIASARIRDLGSPIEARKPSRGEIRYDDGDEEEEAAGTAGVGVGDPACYDGIRMQDIAGRMIPRGELGRDVLHVVFTDRLCCTYDDADRRYHARALVGSNPAIISTTGIIEAPARPREYYIQQIARARMGADAGGAGHADAAPGDARLAPGAFLEYGDARLAAAAEGYFLQALLYYATGEGPFCANPDCRLFNAHWQSELLHAQVVSGRLCRRHARTLEAMKNLN